MNSNVEEVKSRINIVDLISEYIRLQKAGSNYKALCPFHNEKTPSFMVSEEKQIWHCFGCGKGGDIFSFVMEIEGLDFKEALETLARKAGVRLEKFSRPREEGVADKNRLYSILELATRWYEKNLWAGKGGRKVLAYLRKRGLKDGTIKKFRLGYAPEGWRHMLEFLTKRGYKLPEIAQTGLLVEKAEEESRIKNQESRSYDRFRDRIIFPIFDIMGRPVGFSARVAPGGDETSAKYVNTPQTVLYDKSRTLYGLHLAKTEIKRRDEAILVEGNTDVVASHQAGFENTIAVCGTALTSEQIKIIKRYTENLKMCFDMDEAGQAAARRSAKEALKNDLNIKVISISAGKDAADCVKEDEKEWKRAVEGARGIMEFYFEDAFSRYDSRDPRQKKKIAQELLNIIKDIASPIEQACWVKALAERLDIDEKVLMDVLKTAGLKEKKIWKKERREEIQKDKSYSLERKILGLLLNFPDESRREVKSINVDYFQGRAERNILEVIKKNKADYTLDKIRSALADYEDIKLVNEVAFETEVQFEHQPNAADPVTELRDCVKRLAKNKLKEKVLRLSRDIKTAEANGDREAVKILMNEFQSLTSRINN